MKKSNMKVEVTISISIDENTNIEQLRKEIEQAVEANIKTIGKASAVFLYNQPIEEHVNEV